MTTTVDEARKHDGKKAADIDILIVKRFKQTHGACAVIFDSLSATLRAFVREEVSPIQYKIYVVFFQRMLFVFHLVQGGATTASVSGGDTTASVSIAPGGNLLEALAASLRLSAESRFSAGSYTTCLFAR